MAPTKHGARMASRRSLVAYTSIIPVHRLDNALDYTMDEEKCSRSPVESSLERAVDEALNQDKSEQDLFQSAIGCTLESAFADMCAVKKMWHKEKGVQGFHLVQSFAAGEVTPELAHQIGLEFAEQLLGGKFQAVVSTHLNTKCIHNHIVWNAVSMENGKKYRSNRQVGTGGPALRPVAGRAEREAHLENAHSAGRGRGGCRFPHLETVPADIRAAGLYLSF